MIKHKMRRMNCLALAVLLAFTAIAPLAPRAFAAETQSTASATATQNFYEYVNGAWLEKNKNATKNLDPFSVLSDKVSGDLAAVFDAKLAAGLDKKDDARGNMLRFYAMARDTKQRDAQGVAPIQPYIDKINAIKNIADLEAQVASIPCETFFSVRVDIDVLETSRYVLIFDVGSISLYSRAAYDVSGSKGKKSTKALSDYYSALFTIAGETPKNAALRANEAIEIERQLAAAMYKKGEDLSKYLYTTYETYNPSTLKKLDASVKSLNLESIVSEVMGALPKSATSDIIVTSPAYYRALDKTITEKNLPALKSYLLAQLLSAKSGQLTSGMRAAADAFDDAYEDVRDPFSSASVSAAGAASSFFPVTACRLYCDAYFPKEAKEDATRMTKSIVETYEKRIAELRWLSDKTKQQALKKLETMTLRIGYPEPDEASDMLSAFQVVTAASGGSYSGNIDAMNRIFDKYQATLLERKVNHKRWMISPLTVNAYYNPAGNEIVIPAAILQAPFFDRKASASANYGAIGTIIGHEIAHAFDTSGSRFDENGERRDWWSLIDKMAYQKKTDALAAQYEDNENAEDTLDENIADLAGASAALQTAQALPGFDAKTFFQSYATIWRSNKLKSGTPGFFNDSDPHSASEARVNIVLSNIDLFHKTYGTKPGDGMYRPKSERVQIW